jgi:thymidine kinase
LHAQVNKFNSGYTPPIKSKKIGNKNLFGNLYKLFSHADNIVFLTALCKVCNDGTHAIFTKKIIPDDKIVDVGGAEMYQAVCRKHY